MVHLVHDFEDGMHILIGACSVWSAVCGGPWGGWPNIEGMEGEVIGRVIRGHALAWMYAITSNVC